MTDRPSPSETIQKNQEVTERFHSAWTLVDQGVKPDYGTNIEGVAKVFLRSLFYPDRFPPPGQFPQRVDRALLQKLTGFSPFQGLRPSEALLKEAEKALIQRILDVDPPLVENAKDTIDQLKKISGFNIWTVGDYTETQHDLPEDLVGEKDTLTGSGHQLWKLWKAGLTDQPDIGVLVSDNKLAQLMTNIYKQEKEGVNKIVIMDDSFGNLEKAKRIVDQENLNREILGQYPINVDFVLVNQGRKRQVPPPDLSMAGSLGKYQVIDRFDQSPGLLKNLNPNEEKCAVFCDFDGVITDNTAMRNEWDKAALETITQLVDKATLKNPQKAKRGGENLTKTDLTVGNIMSFVEACRAKGLRIGLKNGAYDIVQPGHIGGFDDAKNACDILIVVINSDKSVILYKGVKENVPRPLVTEIQRADVLLGLESVDGVVVFDEKDPSAMIRAIRPDVYITSTEYQGKQLPEFDAAGDIGADIVYTDVREGYSTSSIVRSILGGFLQEMGKKGQAAADAASLLKKLAGYE